MAPKSAHVRPPISTSKTQAEARAQAAWRAGEAARMKDLPSKGELVARIKSTQSRIRAANAVRLLITVYDMTQRKIAKAGDKSLGWVNAMARWAPDKQTSPFGPTTKAERVQHTERRRYKRRNRRRRADGGDRKTKSDWPALSLKGRSASMLPYDHPAVMDGRTIYPKTVQAMSPDTVLLKPGSNQWKLGGEILKGDWRGFPVYALTLEERATCPKTCQHWRSCYGNRMHRAHRMPHGEELERRLEIEVAQRTQEHTNGFAVRLHVLGDFYSVEYVGLWRQLLERHSALHIWGYTARWDVENDPIAAALVALTQQHPDRFAMRFSNAPAPFSMRTISVEHPFQVPDDATLCPQEVDRTESCSTCALCWHSKERIAFIQH